MLPAGRRVGGVVERVIGSVLHDRRADRQVRRVRARRWPPARPTVLLLPPLNSTETFTVPEVGVAHGTWKLICPGET